MNAATESQIDAYLRTLRECLANMTVADREEIIREISVHIRESVEEAGADLGLVLARLGPAEQLAAQYTDDVVVRRAVRSISPLTILRATLHLARRGAQGFVLFCIALIGYAGGIGFILTALLKSFYPRETGLWVGPHTFDFGFNTPSASDPAVHEALGWLYIPIALALGGLFLWLTTYGMRWMLSKMRVHKQPAASVTATHPHMIVSV